MDISLCITTNKQKNSTIVAALAFILTLQPIFAEGPQSSADVNAVAAQLSELTLRRGPAIPSLQDLCVNALVKELSQRSSEETRKFFTQGLGVVYNPETN